MKRGRLIKLWFLAVLGLAGALVMVVLPSRELSYQGLTLNEWLEDFDRGFYTVPISIWPRSPNPSDPVEAVRSMGQPAVDALLERMTYEDPPWKLRLIALARKQSLIKVSFKPAAARRGGAFSALCELGPSASNAVPRLVAWLSDRELGDEAEMVLAHIGRASVEPLRARLAHGDPKDRLRAAQVLGWIGPDAAPAVPQLIDSLSDTNQGMRGAAIRALGAMGEPRDEIEQRLISLLHVPQDAFDAVCGLVLMGTNSIPVLTRAMTNEHPAVRWAGAGGVKFWQDYRRRTPAERERNPVAWRRRVSTMFDLKLVQLSFQKSAGGKPQAVAALLVGNLDDPDPRVRELSAAMLAEFPKEAGRSVPELEKCLQDADASVRAAARQSLEKLPKYLSVAPGFSPQETNPQPSLGPGAVVMPPTRQRP